METDNADKSEPDVGEEARPEPVENGPAEQVAEETKAEDQPAF